MITTTYKCDKCQKVQMTPEDFWEMHLRTNPAMTGGRSSVPQRTLQVCRRCLEDFGLVPIRTKREEPVPAKPTVEELIREMVERAVEEGGHP